MHLLLIRWRGPKDVDQGIAQMPLLRRLWHDDDTVLGLFLAMYVFVCRLRPEPIAKLLLFWQPVFGARFHRPLPIQELIVPREAYY